jgi:hypothetical protein
MAKEGKLKSAYELALERLEQDGIEKPRHEGLPPEIREAIAEVRRNAEAKLAELEILFKDGLRDPDPEKRREQEDNYQHERRRIEVARENEIEKIRGQDSV